ncbi:MAG: helix-turn-helix domain-containing protein [Armatimonadetes bacterium]|nr:helix-turn-helix domain-containing protein [Armatimonadota bacterium]
MKNTSDKRRSYRKAWDPTPMPDAVKEIIADAFIQSCLSADEEHPAYSEDVIERKNRRDITAEEKFAHFASTTDVPEDIDTLRPQDLAHLSPEERQIFELYASGCTTRQIARQTGLTRGVVARVGQRAALRNARSSLGTNDWAEVYRCEVRRPIYSKPQHCPEQACQRLGYCKYAL